MNVLVLAVVDHFEQHVSLVLIEVFRCRIYLMLGSDEEVGTVKVCSGIGAADNHDGCVSLEETKVANGRFQQMAIFLQPDTSECQ